MSWLKKPFRDRSSKQEADFDYDHSAATYRPNTSYGESSTAASSRKVSAAKDSQFPATDKGVGGGDQTAMLRNSAPAAAAAPAPPYDPHPGNYPMPLRTSGHGNGSSDHVNNMNSSPRNNNNIPTAKVGDRTSLKVSSAFEPTPDPLTRAFNEALKPYIEQINALKEDLESAHQTIQSLSAENGSLNNERGALHQWIDKRGLRPDLPPSLAQTFPASKVAASTLSTQLDRKMTMLNYSLHHLADSAPEPLPASTVTSTLATLLPPINYLASLPSGGPSFAFETLIKLAGNLNSHSTGEETQADHDQIADFYSSLDEAMTAVVDRRLQAKAHGHEDWDVAKDIKRLDKTGAFLKKEMDVHNYFSQSLNIMKNELHGGMFGAGPGPGGAAGPGAPSGGGAHAGMYDAHGGR